MLLSSHTKLNRTSGTYFSIQIVSGGVSKSSRWISSQGLSVIQDCPSYKMKCRRKLDVPGNTHNRPNFVPPRFSCSSHWLTEIPVSTLLSLSILQASVIVPVLAQDISSIACDFLIVYPIWSLPFRTLGQIVGDQQEIPTLPFGPHTAIGNL
jgi:hypothetical protein